MRMKHIYMIAYSLLFIFSSSLYAQDLIVTNNGDSLNCKITKVINEEVYFTYKYKDEIRSSWLRLSEVKHCQFMFFEVPEVPVNKIIANNLYPRFRVAFNSGWGYMTGRLDSYNLIDSKTKNYFKKLKHGFNYDLDFSYSFSEDFGMGIIYSVFFTKNKSENIKIFVDNDYKNVEKLKNNIRTDFIGIFINSKKLSANKKHIFSGGLGIGYLGYVNKGVYDFQDSIIKGNTVAVCGNIMYDIAVYKSLFVGFQLSYLFGMLPQGRINNSPQILNLNENLSRMNLSIGLRFIK